MDHDRLFKELLTTFFVEFLELFFPAVRAYLEPGSLEFLDKEVFTDVTSGERHQADIVVKARFRGSDACFLLHVENQEKPQTVFPQRMFRYFARLHEKYALPVYPIALLAFDAPRRPEPDRYQVVFPDKTVLEFSYAVVQLNRLNWRDFVRQQNPIASALMAKMRIAPEDRPKVKMECLRLLATLRLNPAKMQLISGFIDSYLVLNAEENRTFKAEIEAITPKRTKDKTMQIVTSWMREGIAQGLHQGEAKIVLRQLHKRFGEVSEEMQQRVNAFSDEQLEELADALLDFETRAEAEQWIEAHS